ncbi:MAG TPA: GlsB/YeaQ/YmgE family stress response membrane protein [Aestuariivirga sp.]|nr:GlsB/YeaQ/YmgE family stress response membrane protein [Alphaproteobacteria bacterium]HRX36493.1 GlsB/YeaQ/YmgE family stress response membrane protein [Aestuariivirga sp.]
MMGVNWIIAIILGGLAGFAAEKIMKFDTGLVMNIVLGIVGAVVGNLLFGMIGMHFGTWLGQFVVAILGACILIYVYRLIKAKQA